MFSLSTFLLFFCSVPIGFLLSDHQNARHHQQISSIAGIPQLDSPPSFGSSDDPDLQQQPSIRAKRHFGDRVWTAQQVIEAVFCVFIPPLAVLLHGGPDMLIHVLINVVLWICGWLPGAVHAFWYCFYRD